MALTGERPAAAARRDTDGGVAFDALLRALHPERERAAERYEEMRQRLLRFFTWRGSRWPDELTDETIDRVGRRLAAGETIRAVDVGRYFLGVARNVLRESWQRHAQRGPEYGVDGMSERIAAPAVTADPDQDARLECLDRCLAELGAASRDLVLRYYNREGGAKIEDRRALAAELGLPAGTLRIRLHRLRLRLEACVRACLRARETSSPGAPPSDKDGRE